MQAEPAVPGRRRRCQRTRAVTSSGLITRTGIITKNKNQNSNRAEKTDPLAVEPSGEKLGGSGAESLPAGGGRSAGVIHQERRWKTEPRSDGNPREINSEQLLPLAATKLRVAQDG